MNTDKKYIPPKSVIDTDKEFMLRIGCKLKRMRLDKKLSISKVNHDLLITRKTILYAEVAKSYVSLNIIL
jgi:predicted transcriptional regulator